MANPNCLAQITDESREAETVNRLFLEAGGSMSESLKILGIRSHPPHSQVLIGLRIPYYYVDDSYSHNDGDIDVLVIPLCSVNPPYPQIFSPDYSYIVGIEIKAPYLAGDQLKGAGLGSFHEGQWKPGKKVYGHAQQARKLVECGLDRAALMYIIPTPPQDKTWDFPISYHMAAKASGTAMDSVRIHLDEAIKGKSIFRNDRFGVILFGVGSVAGSRESYSGAYRLPLVIRHAPRNRNHSAFRSKLEEKLRELIDEPFRPDMLPPVIRACSNNQCRKLLLWHPGNGNSCTQCKEDLR